LNGPTTSVEVPVSAYSAAAGGTTVTVAALVGNSQTETRLVQLLMP
jgi:hypothetical protein